MSNNITNITSVIDSFHTVFMKVVELWKKLGSDNGPEIWKNICEIIHENHTVITQIYKKVRNEKLIKETKLNYSDTEQHILSRINTEANHLVKLGLMVTVTHQIMYKVMNLPSNFDMEFNGRTEMIGLDRDITYAVHVADKLEKNILFHAYILIIALESVFDTKFYLGADFEYTGLDPVYKRKKIQLAQLNFEHKTDPRSAIWIVGPSELDPVIMKNFVRLIMCNKRIRKILHGSDALDIPYIYEQMLENNPTKIIKFTDGLIDTRFLCEYYKINKGAPDHKCQIYDALLYFDTIDQAKYTELNNIVEEELTYKHDVMWNIYKLSTAHIRYALYDVLFLKYFYYGIIRKAALDGTNVQEQKNIIILYKNVIYELTQFVYLDNNKIVFVKTKCKEEIDPVNNYMVRKNSRVLKLVDIANQIGKEITTTNPYVELDKLLKVNHFKKILEIIIKKIIYTLVSRNYVIYKDKMNIWPDKLSNEYLFGFFDERQYVYLGKMFREIEKILSLKLKLLFA